MSLSYESALVWLVREHGGGGGHPPKHRHQVSGWITVRLVAHIFNKTLSEVANDIVDLFVVMDDREHERALANRAATERQRAFRKRQRELRKQQEGPEWKTNNGVSISSRQR